MKLPVLGLECELDVLDNPASVSILQAGGPSLRLPGCRSHHTISHTCFNPASRRSLIETSSDTYQLVWNMSSFNPASRRPSLRPVNLAFTQKAFIQVSILQAGDPSLRHFLQIPIMYSEYLRSPFQSCKQAVPH